VNTLFHSLFKNGGSNRGSKISATGVTFLIQCVAKRNGAGGELVSLCKHHTYTVIEAMLRISLVMPHVKCITLVYPVVYPYRNLLVME
jgi:hypothetical protein